MIRYEFDAPVSPAVLSDLRHNVGWNRMQTDLSDPRLKPCLHLCAFHDQLLVGYAAAITNGLTDAYIQDVMVHTAYQHQGIGTKLMEQLIEHLKADDIYMVSVIYGEEELRPFYEKFGFCTMRCGQIELRPGRE